MPNAPPCWVPQVPRTQFCLQIRSLGYLVVWQSSLQKQQGLRLTKDQRYSLSMHRGRREKATHHTFSLPKSKNTSCFYGDVYYCFFARPPRSAARVGLSLNLPTLVVSSWYFSLVSLSGGYPASDPDQPPTRAVPQTYALPHWGTRSPPSRAPRRRPLAQESQQEQRFDGDEGAPCRTSARSSSNIFDCIACPVLGRSHSHSDRPGHASRGGAASSSRSTKPNYSRRKKKINKPCARVTAVPAIIPRPACSCTP